MASGTIAHRDTTCSLTQLNLRQSSGLYASCSRSLPVIRARLVHRQSPAVYCSAASPQTVSATQYASTAQMSVERFLSVRPQSGLSEKLQFAKNIILYITCKGLLYHHCSCVLQTTPGGETLDSLERADSAWRRLCDAEQMPFKEVIRETREPMHGSVGLQHVDVIILGG